MKRISFVRAAAHWYLKFLQLQLFITLFSLPILIIWGLPISLLSPLGNLIFNPFLTIFLFLSSLLFFLELLHFPNYWLALLLEWVTHYWLIIMHADSSWLVGFAQPMLIVLIVLPLLCIGIMLLKKARPLYINTAAFITLFFLCFFYCKTLTPHKTHQRIACHSGHVDYFFDSSNLIIIDTGFIGQRISSASWVQHTLIPELIRTTGKTTIDHLIVLQPTNFIFEALERIVTKCTVKKIYLPFWHGPLSKIGAQGYYHFKKSLDKSKTEIIRLGSQPVDIQCGDQDHLKIEPLYKQIKASSYRYPAYKLEVWIDNDTITLYSAKYINKTHTQK